MIQFENITKTFTGVTALDNGNFVVDSPDWGNGTATNVGAVTWASGIVGVSGVVSASNSLIGSTADDRVGRAVLPRKRIDRPVVNPASRQRGIQRGHQLTH